MNAKFPPPRRSASTLFIAAVSLAIASQAAHADPVFSVVASPSPSSAGNVINALAPIASNDVWALGFRNSSNLNDSNTLIQHWNGQSWGTVLSPNPGSTLVCKRSNTGNVLTAAAAIGSANVWAVGYDFSCASLLVPMVVHWDGARWAAVSTPVLNTNDNAALNGVAARGASDIYAVGYQPAANGAVQTLIEHWNGTAWGTLTSPNASATGNVLMAVTAAPGGGLWAVGDSVDQATTSVQTLVLHSSDGLQWTVVPSPNPLPASFLNQNVLLGVAARANNDVTAVGYALDFANQRRLTLIEHWDGNSWQLVSSPNISSDAGSLNALTSVTSFSGGLYAAGYFADSDSGGNFRSLLERYDGANWSIISSPGAGKAQQLFGIGAVPGTGQIWGGGAYSVIGTDTESGLLITPRSLSIFSPAG